MHLWDKLLPQAEITLNLLRTSRTHPKISSYTHQNGPFDFNRTPLAPPGTKIILHEKPKQRQTWAPHGLEGWYLGPAMDHYRCYHVYVPSTRSTCIVDTIEFFLTTYLYLLRRHTIASFKLLRNSSIRSSIRTLLTPTTDYPTTTTLPYGS